jgi:flap endonuclease-1
MGIKNLLKFLSNYPDLIKEKKIESFYGKKIAIDISILMYQVVIAIRNSGSDLTNSNGDITSHILGLFNKTINFLEKGIIPVFVFDGKPPDLKRKVLDTRRNIRNKSYEKMIEATTEEEKIKYFKRTVCITKEQTDQCRELLELMGIPYIDAPEEADSELSYLCKNNLVYAVLTEDMDILTFGSPKIIRNLTSNKKAPIEIELDEILQKLDLTYEEFIELCILFGCDYCTSLSELQPKEIYNHYINNNKNIDDTISFLKSEIDYKSAKQYFIDSYHTDIDDDKLKLKKPQVKKLLHLLVNKYGLIKYKVANKLSKLLDYFNTFKNV